jgi:hypothetical protein
MNLEECLPGSNASMQTPKMLLQIYYYNITRKKPRNNNEPRGLSLFSITKEKPAQDDDELRGLSLSFALVS